MAGSGTQQSIFEQIATSVSKAKVVVACVSQEQVSNWLSFCDLRTKIDIMPNPD